MRREANQWLKKAIFKPWCRMPRMTSGGFIRAQREAAQVSVRQLAEKAGVSNPYLSQIERGLRKPSAEVLSQIAKR